VETAIVPVGPALVYTKPKRWRSSVIPESSNFFASLPTASSRRHVVGLFSPPTWSVRKWSWTDYEVTSPFAELVVEAESPILMHGPVADVESNVDRILAPLRAAGVAYTAECYDAGGEMLREWRWGTD
jgi:hypothetical protein